MIDKKTWEAETGIHAEGFTFDEVTDSWECTGRRVSRYVRRAQARCWHWTVCVGTGSTFCGVETTAIEAINQAMKHGGKK
jgi:hypothetical protein